MSESPRMGIETAVAGGVLGAILMVFGFLELSVCGSGLSLILFGFGILAIGVGAASVGGLPALWGAVPVWLVLLVGGLILAHNAGCGY